MAFLSICVSLFIITATGMRVNRGALGARKSGSSSSALQATSTFSVENPTALELKMQLLQLGCSLDRGQLYNPTSGEQYGKNMGVVKEKIEALKRGDRTGGV